MPVTYVTARRRGRDGEPGLRDPQARAGDRQDSRSRKAIAIEQHMAALPTDAGPLLDEVGRRVAHHL